MVLNVYKATKSCFLVSILYAASYILRITAAKEHLFLDASAKLILNVQTFKN